MNKKLFSWKALAGLALLVAMGLTSCKQDNANIELDENGNYVQPAKPVTPTAKGTTLSGFKTVAELNNLIAGTKDITDNIAADKSVTINLDCSNLEAAAGDEIVIPSKTDATINLVFTNKAKKNEGLVISDAALDNLTITFPEGEFGDVAFDMPYSTLTVASAGASTLGTAVFAVNKNDQKELATTIKSGITINSIKTWYTDDNDVFHYAGRILAEDGSKIGALIIDEDYNGIGNDENGYLIPRVYSNLSDMTSVYVKDLNIVANKVSVWAYEQNKKTVVNKITIAEGDTAYVNGGAYANEIVGAGNGAVLGNFRGGSTSAKFTNLTIDGGNMWYGTELKAKFEKCTLQDFRSIYLTSAAKELKFTHENGTLTSIYYVVDAPADAASFKFPFEKCEFATGTTIYPYTEGENVLDKEGKPIKETLYWYNWNDPNDDPDQGWIYKNGLEKITDIPEAVRKGETGSYGTYTFEPKVIPYTAIVLNPAFTECKYDGVAVSTKNLDDFLSMWTNLVDEDGNDVSTNRPVIGDKTYKFINTSEGWIFVEQ